MFHLNIDSLSPRKNKICCLFFLRLIQVSILVIIVGASNVQVVNILLCVNSIELVNN